MYRIARASETVRCSPGKPKVTAHSAKNLEHRENGLHLAPSDEAQRSGLRFALLPRPLGVIPVNASGHVEDFEHGFSS
jgi:hypothetical protein